MTDAEFEVAMADRALASVMDAESALQESASRMADGSFFRMPRSEAFRLADRATQSSIVAANAFGEDLLPGETPDVLRSRMMSAYDTMLFHRSADTASKYSELADAAMRDCTMNAIIGTLGIAPDKVNELYSAEESGDPSAWQSEREQFYYKS